MELLSFKNEVSKHEANLSKDGTYYRKEALYFFNKYFCNFDQDILLKSLSLINLCIKHTQVGSLNLYEPFKTTMKKALKNYLTAAKCLGISYDRLKISVNSSKLINNLIL